jgi:adenylate kinase
MKSILIIGTSDGGKSTIITELCKKLKPTEVHKLNTSERKIETAEVTDIFNNTFIIKVKGKFILVVAVSFP